jgi:NAD(P)H-hydrate epimerase
VRTLFTTLPCPLVVDADGLNALARCPEVLAAPGGPRILTPHPGEFRRLTSVPEADAQRQQNRAIELARQHQIVIVLKGHQTLVTDGTRSVGNRTGNPGMATGGAGDVLTGIVTALVGQGLGAWEAARLGTHVHGLAGDLAAQQRTQVALTARDLLEYLPAAWRQLGY